MRKINSLSEEVKYISREAIFGRKGKLDIQEAINLVADKYKLSTNPEDYEYIVLIALHADEPNSNGDAFTLEELERVDEKIGGRVLDSFILKPSFIEHRQDGEAYGFVLDAHLEKPESEPAYVELCIAIDTTKDPIYGQMVKDGKVDKFSMGCTVDYTVCNVCQNESYDERSFCEHIRDHKMSTFKVADEDGNEVEKLSYEKCFGVVFDEISAVGDPADERAVKEETLKAARKKAIKMKKLSPAQVRKGKRAVKKLSKIVKKAQEEFNEEFYVDEIKEYVDAVVSEHRFTESEVNKIDERLYQDYNLNVNEMGFDLNKIVDEYFEEKSAKKKSKIKVNKKKKGLAQWVDEKGSHWKEQRGKYYKLDYDTKEWVEWDVQEDKPKEAKNKKSISEKHLKDVARQLISEGFDKDVVVEALMKTSDIVPFATAVSIVEDVLKLFGKKAKLKQKYREDTGQKEWALVSRSKPERVLKWFGTSKPSDEEVQKEERRVQYWKSQSRKVKAQGTFKDKLIEEGYKIDEHGIIRSLGKFEAEWYPIIYFWESIMEGFGGEEYITGEGAGTSIFELTEDDFQEVPELRGEGYNVGDRVGVEWMDQGFVYFIDEVTDEDIAKLEQWQEEYFGAEAEMYAKRKLRKRTAKRKLTASDVLEMSQGVTKDADDMTLERHYIQYMKQKNSFYPTGEVILQEKLGNYPYEVKSDINGIFFERVKPLTDEILAFEDSAMNDVVKEVDKFWDSKEAYDKLGLTHNRGILLFGPPGSGKSIALQQVADLMAKRGDIVFFCKDAYNMLEGLKAFRQVEPDRKVVIAFEEADELCEYNERDLLRLMDGDAKIGGVLFLATTNYIDRLPPRMLRPGRFDKKVYVGFPGFENRFQYLNHKLSKIGETEEKIKELAEKTDGLGFGHLRELIAGVYAIGNPVDDVIGSLKFKAKKEARMKRKKAQGLPYVEENLPKISEVLNSIGFIGTTDDFDLVVSKEDETQIYESEKNQILDSLKQALPDVNWIVHGLVPVTNEMRIRVEGIPTMRPARKRKAQERYELFYGSGGHGGPYHSLEEARSKARDLLEGRKEERYIEIRDSSFENVIEKWKKDRETGEIKKAESKGWSKRKAQEPAVPAEKEEGWLLNLAQDISDGEVTDELSASQWFMDKYNRDPNYQEVENMKMMFARKKRGQEQSAYDLGYKASQTETWMFGNIRDELEESMAGYIDSPESLVLSWREGWEQTDQFRLLHGKRLQRLIEAEEGEEWADEYLNLLDEWWEGALTGLDEMGVDVYAIAAELMEGKTSNKNRRSSMRVKRRLAKRTPASRRTLRKRTPRNRASGNVKKEYFIKSIDKKATDVRYPSYKDWKVTVAGRGNLRIARLGNAKKTPYRRVVKTGSEKRFAENVLDDLVRKGLAYVVKKYGFGRFKSILEDGTVDHGTGQYAPREDRISADGIADKEMDIKNIDRNVTDEGTQDKAGRKRPKRKALRFNKYKFIKAKKLANALERLYRKFEKKKKKEARASILKLFVKGKLKKAQEDEEALVGDVIEENVEIVDVPGLVEEVTNYYVEDMEMQPMEVAEEIVDTFVEEDAPEEVVEEIKEEVEEIAEAVAEELEEAGEPVREEMEEVEREVEELAEEVPSVEEMGIEDEELEVASAKKTREQIKAYKDKFHRALRIVATRQLLNMDASGLYEIKNQLCENMINPHGKFAGIKTETALDIIERSFRKILSSEAIDEFIKSADKLMGMEGKAFDQIESDVKSLMPLSVAGSVKKENNEGKDLVVVSKTGSGIFDKGDFKEMVRKSLPSFGIK
jgi:SpoVK/Ycf46/Vps4 family AAA+-type ATPase